MTHSKVQRARHTLRVGLIVNPIAGIGGAVGLKGSDGQSIQHQARELGAQPRAKDRTEAFLKELMQLGMVSDEHLTWYASPGSMGGSILEACGCRYQAVGKLTEPNSMTTAQDTVDTLKLLLEHNIDLLLFVGGDGTARDILTIMPTNLPVIGIPAGVKMHSGVFAVTPRTAAELLMRLVDTENQAAGLVAKTFAEVRDYDDRNAGNKRQKEIQVRTFGELCVPDVGGYLQQTKVGGRESEPLAVEEIASYVSEEIPTDRDIVFGPGSTVLAIKERCGILPATLRGFDIRYRDGSVQLDVAASAIEALSSPLVIVSFSRQQGFLFGRGNQQLSSTFLKHLDWPDDVMVVATRTKLNSLQGRPLLLDTNDEALDIKLSGLVEIIAGYDDRLLHRVTCDAY